MTGAELTSSITALAVALTIGWTIYKDRRSQKRENSTDGLHATEMVVRETRDTYKDQLDRVTRERDLLAEKVAKVDELVGQISLLTSRVDILERERTSAIEEAATWRERYSASEDRHRAELDALRAQMATEHELRIQAEKDLVAANQQLRLTEKRRRSDPESEGTP